MKKILLALFILTIPIPVVAQSLAPKALTYTVDKVSFQNDNGVTADIASLMLYKLYMNGSVSTLSNVICTGTVKPWTCEAPAPTFFVGNNLLEITVTPNTTDGESPKSTQLIVFYGVSQKEIITNTEKQSVLRCQPGTYEIQRITDATKLLGAFNTTTKHIAYSYATANAIYIIACTLLESGT